MSKRIGLLVAVLEESTALVKQLGLQPLPRQGPCRVYGGTSDGASVTMVVSGAGPERARRGARLLYELARPDWLISVGLAGGLAEELGVGAVVLADEVVTPQGDSWKADLGWLESVDLDARPGRVVTVTRVLIRSDDKRALARATGALVVDMESSSLAEVAHEKGIRWAALRAVSDPVGENLPLDFNGLWDKDGQPDLARLSLAALKRPGTLPRLVRFSREVFQARRRLAQGLHTMMGAFAR